MVLVRYNLICHYLADGCFVLKSVAVKRQRQKVFGINVYLSDIGANVEHYYHKFVGVLA